MQGKRFYLASIILGLGFATPVFAVLSNPFGWYGEVNAGGAHISERDVPFNLKQDNSNWGGNVNIGYKFMPYFGMEIGGFGLANSNYKVNPSFLGIPFDPIPVNQCGCNSPPPPNQFPCAGGPVNACNCRHNVTVATVRNYSYGIALRGIAPISCSGFELFAKVGIQHLQEQVDVKRQFRCLGFSDRSHSSTGPWVGVGAQYYFTPEAAVNMQWQQADGNHRTGTFNFFTIGFSYLSYY